MRWKLFVEFCLTIAIIYILAGDLFLPQPYRQNSQQIKIHLHQLLARILPQKTIINPPFIEVESNS